MVKCPYCNELIEDDSCYCDQCGGLLYICPRCRKIGKGKGKRCGACGTALVSTLELYATAQNPDSNSNPNSTNSNPNTNSNDSMSAGGSTGVASQNGFQSQSHTPVNSIPDDGVERQGVGETTDLPIEVSALDYPPMGIRLKLVSGNIIGRTNGPYSSQLSQCIYISGTHARVDFDGLRWSITDLGSRNGSKVNGVRCNPTLTFKLGDTVRLGNFYDFKVI